MGVNDLTIAVHALDDPEVQQLLDELPWGVGDLTAAEFTPTDGMMLVASHRGAPTGCVGVRRLTSEVGEVKRLFVLPQAQRRGIARALLAELEHAARALAYRELWLDTHADEPAALFRSVGYDEIPAYTDHEWARYWFAKRLHAQTSAVS
jgi:GNAT superfamily N-acetyltransferase